MIDTCFIKPNVPAVAKHTKQLGPIADVSNKHPPIRLHLTFRTRRQIKGGTYWEWLEMFDKRRVEYRADPAKHTKDATTQKRVLRRKRTQ